jgi:hypothetical protein
MRVFVEVGPDIGMATPAHVAAEVALGRLGSQP